MEPILFAIFMWFAPNPYHPGEPLHLPPAVALELFELAEQYNGVDAVDLEELVSNLYAEHGRRAPDRIDSISKAGALGIFQVMNLERREANEALGTSYTSDDMLENWRANAAVAAYAIHRMKGAHRTKRRCTKKVRDGVRINSKGELVAVWRKQDHTWWDHYTCSPRARERCAAKGMTKHRVKMSRKLGKDWRAFRDALLLERLTEQLVD